METPHTGRSFVLQYTKEQWGTEPETLWAKFPHYAVLRHAENAKWYGVVMDVAGPKLGLSDPGPVDVLNVKCDSILMGSLLQTPGILPAYHMSKSSWVSILLDGTVGREDIINLLNISYDLTKS